MVPYDSCGSLFTHIVFHFTAFDVVSLSSAGGPCTLDFGRGLSIVLHQFYVNSLDILQNTGSLNPITIPLLSTVLEYLYLKCKFIHHLWPWQMTGFLYLFFSFSFFYFYTNNYTFTQWINSWNFSWISKSYFKCNDRCFQKINNHFLIYQKVNKDPVSRMLF